jgi:hypothetical protein
MPITVEKVKEIHRAKDLQQYDHKTLQQADQWVKQFALAQLKSKLKSELLVRDYVLLMARCHYGSVETDDFLKAMGCYPDWMN